MYRSTRRIRSANYTKLFREGLSDESVTSRRQDRTVVWVFIEILHIGAQQLYKIVIFRVSINKATLDLPLIRPFFCSLLITRTH